MYFLGLRFKFGRLLEFKSVLLPFLFVLLYGSGFVGAKYGLPYSGPLSFLSSRFLLSSVILVTIACLLREVRPSLKQVFHISVAGSLTVAAFSIGVFESVNMGLSPALSALIIALQPILIAVFARRLVGEKLVLVQWCGLLCGLLGVALVVSHNIDMASVSVLPISMSFLGLLGLTCGSLYQKKYCAHMALFTGGAIQSFIAAIICIVLLPFFEEFRIEWTGNYIAALLYMAIAVSVGALTLLYIMLRHGEVSKVASVFYLVPVSAAFAGYLLFGETFDTVTIIGASVVALGVYLTNK